MNESTDTSTKSRSSGRRAANIKERVKQDSREKIESGKRAAADQMAEIADAIDMAGAQLDQSQPTLATYAAKLADGVGGLASRLREDSIEDLYRDVRQVAARHPGMFLLGSAAVGLVLARFMKASGENLGTADDEGEEWQEWRETGSPGDVSSDSAQYGQSGQYGQASTPDERGTEPYRQSSDASPQDPFRSTTLGA